MSEERQTTTEETDVTEAVEETVEQNVAEAVEEITDDLETPVEEAEKPKNDEFEEEADETVGSWNKIEPRGAFTFVFILLAIYLVYWFLTYFEIFIIRGA